MFGKSYLLDLYNCKKGVCDDMEVHYRFLEKLVQVLKMTQMSTPWVIHAPCKWRKTGNNMEKEEIYGDKEGISGFCPLIQSGITVHSIEPKNFSSIDIYTCGPLGEEEMSAAKQLINKTFCPSHIEERLVERGSEYVH